MTGTQLDLRRQLAIALRSLPLLLASMVLGGGAALFASTVQPRVYEAQATLLVGGALSGATDYNGLLASQQLSATYASVATTRPALVEVIAELDLDTTPEELRKRVSAAAALDRTLVTITVREGDPSKAADIANALAQQLIAASPGLQGQQEDTQKAVEDDLRATQDQVQATQAEIQRLNALTQQTAAQQATLTILESRLISLRATHADLLSFLSKNAANLLSLVDPAVPPLEPVSPRPVLNLVLGTMSALLLAAAVVYLAAYLDDSVRTAEEVHEITGLPTLGVVSRIRTPNRDVDFYKLVTLLHPRSAAAEAFRLLRTNIEFASIDAPVRSLVVTSAMPNEGKTVTAANLAIAFAQAGRRVLLIDADLRKPSVHRMFDFTNDHGLLTLLSSDAVSVDAIARPTDQQNLRVLTSGPLPPNPAELLGSRRMKTVFERLLHDADLLVFDCPPARIVADAMVVSSLVDGTLLVVDAKRSHRNSVRQGREALARAGANVLGVVLNRVQGEKSGAYARYYGKEPVNAAGPGGSRTEPDAASLSRRV